MVNDFDKFSGDSEMVQIFNTGDVKAFYGQPESDHFGTFLIVQKCDLGTPVLVYDWAADSKQFLNLQKAFTRNLYNNYTEIKLGKLNTLRKLVADGVSWLPKTAFTADDGWGGVKFPAICKAANSYDSKGVEKIDKKRDVPDYIDIVQEIIPIDREFRIVAFRGKSNDTIQVLQILEKSPKNEKAKDLRVDEALSKEDLKNRPNTKFKWTLLDPAKEKAIIDASAKIIKYIFADNPGLNFSGFDIAVDVDGKAWYIEHNMLPAPVGPTFLLLYKAIFEDWYKRRLGQDMRTKLESLATKYCQGTARKIDFEWDNPMPEPISI
jgi:hypothetical protein